MKGTNRYFRCKKCKMNRLVHTDNAKEFYDARKAFNEEHKECKKEVKNERKITRQTIS